VYSSDDRRRPDTEELDEVTRGRPAFEIRERKHAFSRVEGRSFNRTIDGDVRMERAIGSELETRGARDAR